MHKPSTQQLESCARLPGTAPDFVALLRERLEDHRSNAVKQRDDVDMRWAQGRAQEVEALLDLIGTAPEQLRKAR